VLCSDRHIEGEPATSVVRQKACAAYATKAALTVELWRLPAKHPRIRVCSRVSKVGFRGSWYLGRDRNLSGLEPMLRYKSRVPRCVVRHFVCSILAERKSLTNLSSPYLSKFQCPPIFLEANVACTDCPTGCYLTFLADSAGQARDPKIAKAGIGFLSLHPPKHHQCEQLSAPELAIVSPPRLPRLLWSHSHQASHEAAQPLLHPKLIVLLVLST
jgi:hypothetical protein